jgi:hypothetical protein
VVLGKLWRACGAVGLQQDRATRAREGGTLGSWRTDGCRRAAAGASRPSVRGLYRRVRQVLQCGPAASECARGLGRCAWQEERTTDRGVEREGGTARYDEVNAARVPRRSAQRGAGGSRLETGARSCTDAEATWWPARSVQRSPAGRTPSAPAAL